MLTDIEIADQAQLTPINEIAAQLGLDEDAQVHGHQPRRPRGTRQSGRRPVALSVMPAWDPEVAVDASLARALIASQFPALADPPVHAFDAGWDMVRRTVPAG